MIRSNVEIIAPIGVLGHPLVYHSVELSFLYVARVRNYATHILVQFVLSIENFKIWHFMFLVYSDSVE